MTSQDVPGQECVSGWNGVGLNEQGRSNARAAGAWLKRHGVTELVSSDVRRTRETASIIGRVTGLPVVESDKLRSWHMGALQGLKMQLAKPFLDFFKQHPTVKIPDGEPRDEFDSRVARVRQSILARAKQFPNARTAYVTHSQVMKEAFGLEPKPGGILEVEVDGDKVKVRQVRIS